MTLDELRQRLNDIDRQLIELIATRQAVVDEVGALKQSSSQATRDFAREKRVLEGARENARELGVAPEIAAEVMRLLIQTSLTRQERYRVSAEGKGGDQPALVIGGGGKMGRWFADFLASQGYAVVVADPYNHPNGFRCIDDWQTLTDDFAVTVIATPLKETAVILEAMATRNHKGLIFDVGSLKTPLIPALRKLAASGAQVTSVHPMFGPDTDLLSDKHVIFLDAGSPAAKQAAQQLFEATMARRTDMSLGEHDRLIAYVLGLSHALNIAFFSVLASSGESVPRLADISSTTFDAQLAVASKVAAENPQLYYEIQSLNEFGMEPLRALLEAVQSIAQTVQDKDEAAFIKLMEDGRAYLASRG